MKFLPRWIASVLTIGVLLTLSFCGAMATAASSSMVMHEIATADAIHCSTDSCSTSPVPCVTQCLQTLDSAQQRALVEIVAVVSLPIIALVFFGRPRSHERVSTFWAPPWRSHRLFAFRE